MKIAVGADHGGFARKQDVVRYLKSLGHAVKDMGAVSEDSVDYPDYARRVARAVRSGRARRGVLVCGTGIGMCIAANKVRGIRAAPVWSEKTARLAAEHNGANVLCLSGRLFKAPALRRMVKAWLSTPFGGGRHQRRLDKISAMEKKR
jgi:ribose 5-phosphate isomerase B